MNNNIFKVYSIQKNTNNTNLVEIETIILNGLYRFSILGLNQKNTSDVKDRVYSALRTQKIINLKSNNKKITVNILPNNGVLDNNYDLAIALSFLNQNNGDILSKNIIAVASLSITGRVISTKNILQTLGIAIDNKVEIIVCSKEDILILEDSAHNFTKLIQNYNIKLIVGETLGEIIVNLRERNFYKFNTHVIDEKKLIYKNINLSNDLFKIILSISANRSVMIQKNQDQVIKFIKNLIYYGVKLKPEYLLKLSCRINKNDTEIINNYLTPYIYYIDSQTTQDYIKDSIYESLYGFNVIDNILDVNKDVLNFIKKNHISGVICFYNTCPCGKNYIFFENNKYEDRCLCLQRYILKYKQKIRIVTENFFEFNINNITDKINIDHYKPEDYIEINKIILKYKDDLESYKNTTIDNRDAVIDNIQLKVGVDDIEHTIYILSLTKDIQIYTDIIKNKPYEDSFIIDFKNVDLAIDMIKKDF